MVFRTREKSKNRLYKQKEEIRKNQQCYFFKKD